MNQKYMNMSVNDIIKLVEKKDKKIADLEKELLEMNMKCGRQSND